MAFKNYEKLKLSGFNLIGEFTKRGELVRVYSTPEEASEFRDISFLHLSRCLDGTVPFAKKHAFLPYTHREELSYYIEEIYKRILQEKEDTPHEWMDCYKTDCTFIETFYSIREASYFEEMTPSTFKISSRTKTPRNANYWWIYHDDFPTREERLKEVERRLSVQKAKKYEQLVSDTSLVQEIYQYDSNGKRIGSYSTIKEASQETGFDELYIQRVLTGERLGRKSIFLTNRIQATEEEREIEIMKRIGFDTLSHNESSSKTKETRTILHFNEQGKFVQEFETVEEAEEKTGVSKYKIVEVLTKKKEAYGNHIFVLEDEYKTRREVRKYVKELVERLGLNIKKQNKKWRAPILQYDLEKNYIATHDSMAIASKKTGIFQGMISPCVNGKLNYTKGYIFLRENEYENEEAIMKELDRRLEKIRTSGINKPRIANKATEVKVKSLEEKPKLEKSTFDEPRIEEQKTEETKPLVKEEEKKKETSQKQEKVKYEKIILENILHYDIKGYFIAKYPDAPTAFRQYGISRTSMLSSIRGKSLAPRGNIFLLESDFPTEEDVQREISRRMELTKKDKVRNRQPKGRKILRLDDDGTILKRYFKGKEVCDELGVSHALLNQALNGRIRRVKRKHIVIYEKPGMTQEELKEEARARIELNRPEFEEFFRKRHR
ncbi:NUMOD1 domain-containing DNA-binding protein [Rossellomorea marisflavi]|uniref:NUMOD1 domain-containing DNA-binding protein n=1 Tax=Rossellomorea marisflavi TaxID=189381 RepID=UPI003FA150A2